MSPEKSSNRSFGFCCSINSSHGFALFPRWHMASFLALGRSTPAGISGLPSSSWGPSSSTPLYSPSTHCWDLQSEPSLVCLQLHSCCFVLKNEEFSKWAQSRPQVHIYGYYVNMYMQSELRQLEHTHGSVCACKMCSLCLNRIFLHTSAEKTIIL